MVVRLSQKLSMLVNANGVLNFIDKGKQSQIVFSLTFEEVSQMAVSLPAMLSAIKETQIIMKRQLREQKHDVIRILKEEIAALDLELDGLK